MTVISWIMAVFAVIGALDRIIGNKFGLGNEFEKGIRLLGEMALTMVGMIVIAPLIAKLIEPLTNTMKGLLDPSVIPAMLFANDMGGASLSGEIANSEVVGTFNGLIVAATMGATISFTVPYAVGVVAKEKQKSMFLGMLCGVATIPVGCFVGGLILGVPFLALIVNLLPLIFLAALIAFGLLKFPKVCIKVFAVVGVIIKILVTVGLTVCVFKMLTGVQLIPYIAEINVGMDVIINAMCVMAGAFPLINLISRLLNRPLSALGKKMGINSTSAVGFLSSLATNVTTFGIMNDMDEKGVVLNSAFTVSAAFTFAGHLAFTLAYSPSALFPMIVAKLLAGVLAVAVAIFIYGKMKKGESAFENQEGNDLSQIGEGAE